MKRLVCAMLVVTAGIGFPTHATAKSDKEALKVVEAMIEAHGGMDKWKSARTVYFEDEMIPGDAPVGLVSQVTVEQGRRRIYVDYPDINARVVWDGEKAWSINWGLPMPPRLLTSFNYYFLNLPWLVMDPGVNLAMEGTATLWEDPTEYITVRMTFDAGVGDTPDDYYVLYIHPETTELRATVYVVTYKELLSEGVDKTPEHVLVYDSYTTVDGLKVATHYTIYQWDHSVYATCKIGGWSFQKAFKTTRMTMPEGAVIDETTP